MENKIWKTSKSLELSSTKKWEFRTGDTYIKPGRKNGTSEWEKSWEDFLEHPLSMEENHGENHGETMGKSSDIIMGKWDNPHETYGAYGGWVCWENHRRIPGPSSIFQPYLLDFQAQQNNRWATHMAYVPPKIGMVSLRENPNLTWRMTGGIPVSPFQDTSIWVARLLDYLHDISQGFSNRQNRMISLHLGSSRILIPKRSMT